MKQQNRIKGGLYGLLIGDALGVPFEFYKKEDIPHMREVEMETPRGFQRSYPNIKPGTWSDDGAQALCLLDSLLTCRRFSLPDFADRLLAWYEEGLWAVDKNVFDVGIQTGEALCAYKSGTPAEECGKVRPSGKGNGALMRVLPLAIWHQGSDQELVMDAHEQCLITHSHPCNQVCCALYCLIARYLLREMKLDAALSTAISTLSDIYSELENGYEEQFYWCIRPKEPFTGTGSGYVVDSLKSAVMVLQKAVNYAEAVKLAISLGNDTDTTACITGGLAGIIYGIDGIPFRYVERLRGKEMVEVLIEKMLYLH